MKNFLLLIALLAPAIAQADWVKLVSAGEGEVTVYVDPGSIKREGNVVEFSTLFDYATVRNLSGAPFQSATMQDEIDCAGKRNRTWPSHPIPNRWPAATLSPPLRAATCHGRPSIQRASLRPSSSLSARRRSC